MPFVKGQSGNPGGRPKGRPNDATLEVRALARSLFDQTYWNRVRAQLLERTLHPSIEAKLLAYAYGEPKHEPGGPGVVVSIGFIGADRSTELVEGQRMIDGGAQVISPQARL